MFVDREQGLLSFTLNDVPGRESIEAPEFRDYDTTLWPVTAIFSVDATEITVNNHIPWKERHGALFVLKFEPTAFPALPHALIRELIKLL
jgi:hypothetical protein